MNPDSAQDFDCESRKRFWNDWDARHLHNSTLGEDALERGATALSLLQDCSLQNPEIIEFGCGNGWLAERMAALGRVTGVDIADRAIAEARQRVPTATFYCGDVLHSDLPAKTFNVVVSLEMFSHVSDQSRFVEVMARVLKPGGYVILITQNRTVYMRRRDIAPVAEGQIRNWIAMRTLLSMLYPHFKILKATTMRPAGGLGFLRIVNSVKLSRLAGKLIPGEQLKRLKEKCGLGQTLVVLGQKHSCLPLQSR